MAVQQLTQPIINTIAAFDATNEHIISFSVIGGAQVIGNRLVISENRTGTEIYNKVQNTLKLSHTLPANTLINNNYYNAVIYTIDNAGNESTASIAVPFYCYSQPYLNITNIPTSGIIENGTYAFTANYVQPEGEILNSYQFILYDSNKNILTQSDLIYYEPNSSLAYTFVGMSNDTSYYVEITGQTINGTKITSGLQHFTVRYLQPASFAICDLVNDCENGYIQISSNIVAIDGVSNPDPPIYIDDKEVDLREPDSWVNWSTGFNIKNDFTMRIWGRDFNDNKPIVTMINDQDTTSTPNRIELKWMIMDVLKDLPSYKLATGTSVNLDDSLNYEIKNLNIGGNSIQLTEPNETNTGEYITFESNREKQITIDPQGNSYQASTILPDAYTQVDYIQTTGTQYLNTGFKPNSNTSVKIGIEYPTDITTTQTIFCSREGLQINSYTVFLTSFFRYDYNNKITSTPFVPVLNTRYDIYTKNNNIYINNVLYASAEAATFSSSNELFLSASYTTSITTDLGNFAKNKIYYCKIWNNDILVRNMIPCYRNSDNVIGMYDTVNNVFYTNAGTGTFIKGSNSILPNPDFPIEIKSCGDNINILNPANSENYTITSDGSLIEDNTRLCTDFIPVSSNENEFAFYVNTALLFYGVAFYNDNKEYISRIYRNGGKGVVFTKPDNTKYLRVFMQVDTTTILNSNSWDYYEAKLEKGLTATPYSPYGQGCINEVICNKNLAQDFKYDSFGGNVNNGVLTTKSSSATEYDNYCRTFFNTNAVKSGEVQYISFDLRIKSGTIEKINQISLQDDSGSHSSREEIVNPKPTSTYQRYLFKITHNKNYTPLYFYIQSYKTSNAICEVKDLMITYSNDGTYEPHKEQVYTIPTQQPMRSIGDIRDTFIKKDCKWYERHNINRYYLTGNESIVANSTYANTYNIALSNVNILCNNLCHCNVASGIIYTLSMLTQKDNIIMTGPSDSPNRFIHKSTNFANVSEYIAYLKAQYNAGTPVYVDYVLETPIDIECTEEQITILDQVNNLTCYKGQNNIYSMDEISPWFIENYSGTPSPLNPSKIYETGDLKNLINVSNFNVTYSQKYENITQVDFKPKANFIYSLGFDYIINDSTTDIYYSMGYGIDTYTTDIIPITQYSTQTTGRNTITFQIPNDIPKGSKLFIKFVKTEILANVDVDISNIQLEYGNVATSYQQYGLYNINLYTAGKNLYNINKPMYIRAQNSNYSTINNGYNLTCILAGQKAFIEIGYKNILNPGSQYSISYFTDGSFDKIELYTTLKDDQGSIDKITITNGIFTAPLGVYDLKLVIYVDNTVVGNTMEIWNTQIELGIVGTDYEPYNSNTNILTLDEPLRGIGNSRDLVCLTCPNLMNPSTQSANIEPESNYYFSNNTDTVTTYTLTYKNEEGNVISTQSLTNGIITTPKNCAIISMDLTSTEITTNHIQIEQGNVFTQYIPYFSEPSIVRNIGRIILNGSQEWTYASKTGNRYAFIITLPNKIIGTYTLEYLSDKFNQKNNQGWEEDGLITVSSTSASTYLFISISGVTTVDTLKTWLVSNPVMVDYILATPIITPLTMEQISSINSITTLSPITNVYTYNNSLAQLTFDYVNEITTKETKNAYVLLKCYNMNLMPYVIHSNLIDIPKSTEKIFIWTRRQNNLFDLKIENLG